MNNNRDSELSRLPTSSAPALFDGLDTEAIDFAGASKAASTARAYSKSWRMFVEWCAERRETPAPASPATVANYLAHRAASGSKVSTVRVDLAAIRQAHMLANLQSPHAHPQVLTVMSGIRRKVGVRPNGKDALLADSIVRFCASLPDDRRGRRDRAMLLLGFAGAFRRSELVAVCVEHLSFAAGDGRVAIVLPRSKTDQEGHGQTKVIHSTGKPSCPVAALRAWLSASGITEGPVFRAVGRRRGGVAAHALTPSAVADLVKRCARHCGLPVERLSGHSVRAGFATQAAINGATLKDITDVTMHRDPEVAMGYIRRAELDKANTTGKLGI